MLGIMHSWALYGPQTHLSVPFFLVLPTFFFFLFHHILVLLLFCLGHVGVHKDTGAHTHARQQDLFLLICRVGPWFLWFAPGGSRHQELLPRPGRTRGPFPGDSLSNS